MEADLAKSNWDRLGNKDTEGLVTSLLSMRKELGAGSHTGLDAHPLCSEESPMKKGWDSSSL